MKRSTTLLLSTPNQYTPHFPQSSGDELTHKQNGLLERAHSTITKRYPKMNSLLVIQKGNIVYEAYYNDHTPSTLNDLRSATKSFISSLAGIALKNGHFPDINSKVTEVLRRILPTGYDPYLDQLSIRHLLTMSSGMQWLTGSKLGEPWIRRFHRSRSWTAFALCLPILPDHIGSFQYRSTDSHLLSVILTEGCGMDAFSYARSHLFEPLQIQHTAWTPSPEQHSMGHVGLYLTTRDMGKFGLLCLNKGVWEGQEVIPSSWLSQALQSQVKGYPAFGDYGFQWWTGVIDGQTYSLAHGHGGQQIYLFPELDAVIVFTADSKVRRWRNPRTLLEQYILPALALDN